MPPARRESEDALVLLVELGVTDPIGRHEYQRHPGTERPSIRRSVAGHPAAAQQRLEATIIGAGRLRVAARARIVVGVEEGPNGVHVQKVRRGEIGHHGRRLCHGGWQSRQRHVRPVVGRKVPRPLACGDDKDEHRTGGLAGLQGRRAASEASLFVRRDARSPAFGGWKRPTAATFLACGAGWAEEASPSIASISRLRETFSARCLSYSVSKVCGASAFFGADALRAASTEAM